MAKPITITIKARDAGGQDAPTAEDLLSQFHDFLIMLHGVEEAVTGADRELVWRVTDITRNSPIIMELTPSAKRPEVNIDDRASKVVKAAVDGLRQIKDQGTRPDYFNDSLIKTTERINHRVTNGLAETIMDCSEYEDLQGIEITTKDAKHTIQNITEIKGPVPVKYRELGSIEGFISRVELDSLKRPLVWIRSRIDQQNIKCISKDQGGLNQIGDYKVSEVLEGMRIMVNGMIHYKSMEQVENVEVEDVEVFRADHELPDKDAIVSPNFTSGIEACEYLETLRDDN